MIIAGMHETSKRNRGERHQDDLRSLEEIFKFLKCEHALEKVIWVNRLGEYQPERRGNRLVKVVFENERVARLVKSRAPRLAEDNLLGHIVVRDDESREERDRKWAARTRNSFREAGQGNMNMNGGRMRQGREIRTPKAALTSPRYTQRNGERRGRGSISTLRDHMNTHREHSIQTQTISGCSDTDYITWDEWSEGEGESRTEVSTNEDTDYSVNSSGTGLESGLRQRRAGAAIQRLMEATRIAAENRIKNSGNGRSRGKTKKD